jgi:uncharacterized membrane protein YphA (DoxX/SURF4 family)
MLPTKTVSVISTALRIAVGATFIAAATLKFQDPAAFAEQTANYQLFPELSYAIAAMLPSIEIVASLVLIFGKSRWREAAAVIILGLLVTFTSAILRAWALGINLECGCFGEGSSSIGPVPVIRNVSLTAALVLSLFLEFRQSTKPAATAA